MAYSTPVLLHFNGTNGSTVYPNDNTAGPTFANVPSGVASLTTSSPPLGTAWLFGGADNQLGGVVSSTSLYIPKQTDFSIEGRFQTTNAAFNGFVCSLGDLTLNPRSLALRLNSPITNAGDLRIFIGGQLACFSAAASVSNSTPLAYGIFRIAGVLYLTIGGALQGVWRDNGDFGPGKFYVGNCLNGGALDSLGSSFNFSHDEVRVTIGLARQKRFPYTVATAAFVLDSQPGPTVVALAKKRERTLFGGAQSAAAYTLSVDPATYTLTAAAQTLQVGRVLSFAPASYAVTASPVTLSFGAALNVSPASYTITAADETLTATRALTISPASYAVTASAVTLSAGRALSIDATSYSITAAAQTLIASRALSIDPASYVISAADITLTYASTAKELSFDPASYAVTASPVTVTATRALSIEPEAYAVTAAAVTLSVGRQVNVDAVSYSITASPVSLIAERSLSIDPASYVITTPDVGLTYTPAGSIDYELLAAAVWAYTLSNGKTAEQTLVENNEMLEALSALPNLDTPIEGAFSSADLLRVIASVAAGKTSIDAGAPGTATVEFRDVNDSVTRVSADMVGSERVNVTVTP